MDNNNDQLVPLSGEAIARARAQCHALVRKRAALAAGVAAVPIPGMDVLTDLTTFALLIEEINKAFGLTPAQIERLQPRLRIVAYQAAASVGGMLVGKIITKELILHVFKRSGIKLAAKSVARFVPLAGQVASAAIGFALFQKMGNQHVEACARVAQEVSAAR